MPELEIEFKNLLDEDEYSTLYDTFFKRVPGQSLVNYYIDTPDLALRRSTLLLRVRRDDGKQIMTLKAPAVKGVLEFNAEVDLDLDNRKHVAQTEVPGVIADELEKRHIGFDDLNIYGSLATERHETEYEGGLLVLDRSSYLGSTDYEIEYEVSDYDEGEALFNRLMAEHDIPRRGEVTKSERFYRVLRKGKDEAQW
ncbi:CYTH domain-containing protein [Lacicoccus alkaliphilus]|uniref:Uncharacterized protein YjbK n=1 Tax=Lacicoccus alkaliphilus DSM 16010 TaxID=1123231 RepID=A0A1M7G5B5_9BACL|nr:CYTH domain-containing protein [Salinicoccus alkaliphilus]SHM11460.1 Uncharacterized protein YjbK [Salinicoccus alkaliphilus DSM 16010]